MEQTVINWLFTAVGATMGWVVKVIWDAIQDLKRDVSMIERNLPAVYVRKDDFKDSMNEMKSDMRDGFARIENTLNVLFKKLDSKEDR